MLLLLFQSPDDPLERNGPSKHPRLDINCNNVLLRPFEIESPPNKQIPQPTPHVSQIDSNFIALDVSAQF